MKKLILLSISFLATISVAAQTRKNFVYLCPFPYNASIGVDHAVQISHKKWSSGRLYFVASPNILWTGYSETSYDTYMESSFSQYEFVLPIHLRYEFTPYRILTGSKPGKHDFDFSVFFDVGLSLNYIFAANLKETFNYRDPGSTFNYTFNGSITSSIENKLSANYLTFNFGFRIRRYLIVVRHYEPFVYTQYNDISKDWGKPAGAKSYFYDDYIINPYYKQGTNTICLGYTF